MAGLNLQILFSRLQRGFRGRIVFDIGGNKFRLVARVVYGPYYRVMIKFVGTHAEYNKINVNTI